MTIELKIPESLEGYFNNSLLILKFRAFLQSMLNRLCVGQLRYGFPRGLNRRKHYLDLLCIELDVYIKKGNFEQLLNVAVYCFLESELPQNSKFHFNPTVDSVNRNKV